MRKSDRRGPSDVTLVVKNREQLFSVLERLHASGVLSKLIENEHGELGVKITPRSDHITPIFTVNARQKGKIELVINHHTLTLHPEHMQPFADAATKDKATTFAANEAASLSPLSLKTRALIAKQDPTELAALLNEIMPANLPAKWTFQTHRPMQGGDSHTFSLRLPNGADSDAVIAALHEARVIDKNSHTKKSSTVEFSSPGQRRSFVEFDMSGKTGVLTISDAFMGYATSLPFEGMANYAQALKERGTRR